MADTLRHPTEALQDAVDGRLDAAGRAALDAHLATCDRCRREMHALRMVKAHVAATAMADPAPADLEARLRGALDAEDRHAASRARTARTVRAGAWWLAAAAGLALAVWIGADLAATPLPARAAADLRAFAAGELPLALETAEPPALEAHFGRSALTFDTRVFDFGMMDYRLVGGSLHRVARETSALFAYRDGAGHAVVCQMYLGTTADLPAPAERRFNDGIEFLVYREGSVTVVFWQEGDVVCVLAADDDPEATVQLAFAKAVKV